MPDKMAEDHARDYAAKGKIDAVRSAIADLASDEDAWGRLSASTRAQLAGADGALTDLNRVSAHIVAVWD
jgi:hypothetical protein